jgi:hypothetical protein
MRRKDDGIYHQMRRFIFISAALLLAVVGFYEIEFRYCTAKCGEVDMESRPPRVYYSDDLLSSFPWRRMIFGFRVHLPLGKVKIAPSSAYIEGNRFYRRLPDGKWQDLTDAMIEYQKQKNNSSNQKIN